MCLTEVDKWPKLDLTSRDASWKWSSCALSKNTANEMTWNWDLQYPVSTAN